MCWTGHEVGGLVLQARSPPATVTPPIWYTSQPPSAISHQACVHPSVCTPSLYIPATPSSTQNRVRSALASKRMWARDAFRVFDLNRDGYAPPLPAALRLCAVPFPVSPRNRHIHPTPTAAGSPPNHLQAAFDVRAAPRARMAGHPPDLMWQPPVERPQRGHHAAGVQGHVRPGRP